MTALSHLRLRVWDSASGAAVELPLAGDEDSESCSVSVDLRCLAGASALHLVVSDADAVRLRVELDAEPDESVTVDFEVDDHDDVHVSSRGREVLFLPPDARYEALRPIVPRSAEAPLDVAIVVDGTLLHWKNDSNAVRLLAHQEAWAAHVDSLVQFVGELAGPRDLYAVVLAFGDQKQPGVAAESLRPAYHLHPGETEQVLQRTDGKRLQRLLLAVPPTSGGDYVDALADALAACTRLHWRSDARKLVIVVGDSPGYSFVDPPPPAADLCIRTNDVETQAHLLHQYGVEILTIHHAPPAGHRSYALAFQRELLAYTQRQYARLATCPALSFSSSSFDPVSSAVLVHDMSGPVARGAALPEHLARVTPSALRG